MYGNEALLRQRGMVLTSQSIGPKISGSLRRSQRILGPIDWLVSTMPLCRSSASLPYIAVKSSIS